MTQFQHERDPVVDSMPADWTSEQKTLANDAMKTLHKHYWGWAWAIEFTDIVGESNQCAMIIRLTDVPTDMVYIVQLADLTKEGAVMRAGGEFLEALGLSRTKGRWDEVRGLKKTPGGLVIPAYAAIPENNPGYETAKAAESTLR